MVIQYINKKVKVCASYQHHDDTHFISNDVLRDCLVL